MSKTSDILFTLGLKSQSFDEGMKRAQEEIKKLNKARLNELQKELESVAAGTKALSKTDLNRLNREFAQLGRLMKETNTEGGKVGKWLADLRTGIGQGIGQAIAHGVVSSIQGSVGLIKEAVHEALSAGAVDAKLEAQLKASGDSPEFLEKLKKRSEEMRDKFAVDDDVTKRAFYAMSRGKMGADSILGTSDMLGDILGSEKGRAMGPEKVGQHIAAILGGQFQRMRALGVPYVEDPTKTKAQNATLAFEALGKAYQGQAEAYKKGHPGAAIDVEQREMFKLVGLELLPTIRDVAAKLATLARELRESGVFKAIGAWIKDKLDRLVEIVGNFDLDNIGQSISTLFTGLFATLGKLFDYLAEKIEQAVGNALTGAFGLSEYKTGREAWNEKNKGFIERSKKLTDFEKFREIQRLTQFVGDAGKAMFPDRAAIESAESQIRILKAQKEGKDPYATYKGKGPIFDPNDYKLPNGVRPLRTEIEKAKAKHAAEDTTAQAGWSADKVKASQVAFQRDAAKIAKSVAKMPSQIAKAVAGALKYNQSRLGVDITGGNAGVTAGTAP